MAVPRMRTASGILAEIRAADPKSEISLHFIRQIIHQERVPVVQVGRKKWVDLDTVLDYIRSGNASINDTPTTGVIRKVQLR